MPKPHLSSFIIHPSLLIILSLFIIHFSLFISGCTSSTKPQTGSLSGIVTLVNDTGDTSLDPVDFSGVTVALYRLAVLDSTIVRINQEYPQIGVQISQETEFDHRLQTPVRVTSTDASGGFDMNNISVGKYNCVVYKQDWGFRYYYNVEILKGENTISNSRDSKLTLNVKSNSIELYPVRILDQVINTPIQFIANRTYRATSNTIVFSDATVQDNAVILLDSSVKMDFYGSVSGPPASTYWKISAADHIYSTELASGISAFDQVGFYHESTVNVDNLIFEYSNNGIRGMANNFNMEGCLVRKNAGSALVAGGANSSVNNCLVMDNPVKAITAFNAVTIENSTVFNNHDACFLSEATAEIRNNYFIQNYIGVRPFYGTVLIEHNNFDKNDNAISPCASDPSIIKNCFYDNVRDIELNNYYVQSSFDYCNPGVEFNNFFGNGWYVHLRGENSVYGDGVGYGIGVNSNQVYPNNYLVSPNLIPHVYDSQHPQTTGVPFSVMFSPRRSSSVGESGIHD